MATYGLLHPKYIFGLNADCKGTNVYYVDVNTIIYPAGNTVVIYNVDQKTQSFLHGVEKGRGITALAISPIKVHVAVAQYGDADKPPSIVVFDLKLNKKRKTLQFPAMVAKEYISLAFTHDCLELASLTGAPEYNVVFWKWEKSRMLCQAKTTGSLGPVYEISTSPAENNVMCAVGKASFRFFRYNEGHIKPFGFQRGDAFHFLCHAWLGKGDRLVAGTTEGRLMFFERGEYKYDIPVPTELLKTPDSLLGKSKPQKADNNMPDGFHGKIEDLVGTFGNQDDLDKNERDDDASTIYERKEITAIIAYSKGFAIGHGSGNVIVYEEQLVYETPEEHYKHIHIIRIPADTTDPADRIVRSLAINTSEEIIIATSSNSQIFYFALASAEIKDPSEMVFEYASCGFHFGAIIAMDVAIRKSLFVSAGADRFIRVWNYVTMAQEASREEDEEIASISLHPTGLFILAAMTDKIRMFTILMDSIREVRDFHIRGVRECIYSHGGHFFAAANGNVVQVYTTTSFENTHNLKGHNNKIRKLKWSVDDTKLYSVGSDGAIYEWNVSDQRRMAEFVERGSTFVDAVPTPDTRNAYALTSLKFIKEIQLTDNMLLKEQNLGLTPFCITTSRSGRALFAGMDDGIIRSFRQPLTYVNEWFDFRMHVLAVNAIAITFDEVYCISGSEDGSIILWKITDPEGRVSKMEKDVSYASEVLITRSDLEDRDMAMRELKTRFGELRLEMEYQVKRKEMVYIEEIKSVHSKYTTEIAELNEKIEELIETKKENDGTYHTHVEQMAIDSKATVENIEAHYNSRLIAEFEKYNELQNLLEETINDYESRMKELDGERATTIDEMVEYFEGKLKDKNNALEQSYEDSRNAIAESDEMRRQIEEDADEEIVQLRHAYEKKLITEREINGKLKAEAGIMRKNFTAMQKEIEEQKADVQRLLHEGEKMKTVITITEKEVSTLRKDLVDRDVNVMGKEKVIFDLKKTNNELEKFKFVLDYKIKELKKLIEPKEREIIYLKQQNADMEHELDTNIAIRNGLELQVNELTNKLRVTDHEYQIEKRLRWRFSILVQRIRGHLSRCMGLLQDHAALKSMVKNMYAKYGHTLVVGKASNAEQEAICELVRQKNHLEMCLTSMKRKMSKDVDYTRAEQLKIMHENMLLVFEINNLRRELKLSRDRIILYENTLGVTSSSRAADQAEMRIKLQAAIMDKDELVLDYNKDLEAKENLIEAQQKEIDNLAAKIYRVNEFEIRPETAPAASMEYVRVNNSDLN